VPRGKGESATKVGWVRDTVKGIRRSEEGEDLKGRPQPFQALNCDIGIGHSPHPVNEILRHGSSADRKQGKKSRGGRHETLEDCKVTSKGVRLSEKRRGRRESLCTSRRVE